MDDAEIPAGLIVIILAVSAGLMFSVRIQPPFRWAGRVAGVVIVGLVVAAGVAIEREPAWCGAFFGILTCVAAVLTEAEVRRDEPRFVAEPYWRRVLLVLSRESRGSDVP